MGIIARRTSMVIAIIFGFIAGVGVDGHSWGGGVEALFIFISLLCFTLSVSKFER